MATRKSGTKKAPAKKAAVKKGATKKASAKKTATGKGTTKKAAVKKATTSKGGAKKAAVKKATTSKGGAKKAAVKKTAATKATTKKAAAKKATTKKAGAKKAGAKKATRKATTKKAAAKKATTKKAAATRATTKKTAATKAKTGKSSASKATSKKKAAGKAATGTAKKPAVKKSTAQGTSKTTASTRTSVGRTAAAKKVSAKKSAPATKVAARPTDGAAKQTKKKVPASSAKTGTSGANPAAVRSAEASGIQTTTPTQPAVNTVTKKKRDMQGRPSSSGPVRKRVPKNVSQAKAKSALDELPKTAFSAATGTDSNQKFTKKELDRFTRLIQEFREESIVELEELSEQLREMASNEGADDNSYSLHMAEQGTDAMEREKTFLQAQRTSDYIKKLDEALVRINNGTFGLCRICGLRLDSRRLTAVPVTQVCTVYKNTAKPCAPGKHYLETFGEDEE